MAKREDRFELVYKDGAQLKDEGIRQILVDTETGEATGEQGEIPAGTQCTFWRTNGVDTVDLMLEDGSAYRFKVDPQSSPITVNGINYDEAFEGMQFAG